MAPAGEEKRRRSRPPAEGDDHHTNVAGIAGLHGPGEVPVRDAFVLGEAEPLPTPAAEAPPAWVDPSLLSDELDGGADPLADLFTHTSQPPPAPPDGPPATAPADGASDPLAELFTQAPQPAPSPPPAAPRVATPPPPAPAPTVPVPPSSSDPDEGSAPEADAVFSAPTSESSRPPSPAPAPPASAPETSSAPSRPPEPEPQSAPPVAPPPPVPPRPPEPAPEPVPVADTPAADNATQAALPPAPDPFANVPLGHEAKASFRSLEERLDALYGDDDEDEEEGWFDTTPAPPAPASAPAATPLASPPPVEHDAPEWGEQEGGNTALVAHPSTAPSTGRLGRLRRAASRRRLPGRADATPPAHLAAAGATPPAPAAGGPQVVVSCSRGTFAAHSALSVLSDNLTQDTDELNDAFGAFSLLEEGQTGFIRLSFRTYEGFRKESHHFVTSTKTGQDPNPKRSPLRMLFASIGWALASLNHYGSDNSGREAPRPPWKKPEVKPLRATDMSEELRGAIRDAEVKSRDVAHYEVALRIGVVGRAEDQETLDLIRQNVEAGFGAYATAHQRIVFSGDSGYDAAIGMMMPEQSAEFVLSAGELGELARVPDDLTHPHGIIVPRARIKQLTIANPIIVPDRADPPKGMVPLGMASAGTADERVLGMRNAELDQHMLVVGRTGTGKSVFMHWLVHGVAKSDYPIVVIDPHGALGDDLARNLIRHCPERVKDVVIVDFAEELYPVALNPLDVHSYDEVEPAVSAVKEMLEHQLNLQPDSAPRAIIYAQQALTVLTEANLHLKDPETKCTLLQIPTFFQDAEFRHLLLNFCSNPSVREAFDPEKGVFERLGTKQQAEVSQPVLRAFQRLSSSRSFANVFSAGANRLDFTKLINRNSIVLLKLSRFSSQRDLAGFVGSLVIPWMLGSMDDWGRTKDPVTGVLTGRGCRLFIDEAPTVCGPNSSAVAVLAEARKWDLGLVAAAQYPRQFDRAVEEAFYANTATKVTLALDPGGVGGIARSLAGDTHAIGPDDIVALPNYTAYANVLLAGSGGKYTSGPFSMQLLPPMSNDLTSEELAVMDDIVARSRELVCNQRDEIEAKRLRIVDDIRSALNQALQDRLPEHSSLPADGPGFEEANMADEGFDWNDLVGS